MRLQHQIIFPQARYLRHLTVPTKDDPKVTFEFRTALTREVAEAFGCRELIFAGDVPRSGVASMALEGAEADCEIHIKHDAVAFSAVAKEIGHYVSKFEGTGPELHFRVKMEGHSDEAATMAKYVKIDPLEITLKPAQMDLGLQEAEEGTEGEEPADTDVAPEFASTDPPLASVIEMGGSHQRVDKRKRRKGPAPEPAPAPPPEPEEGESDFFNDVDEGMQTPAEGQ